MAGSRLEVKLYHITDISNLPGIIATGGLLSDVRVSAKAHSVIGYDHLKQRRMTEIRVPCCGNRFVGEFVPFYYCPRSPMLFTINVGRTSKPAGHQREVVHLVTTIGDAVGLGSQWAISDGNASAYAVSFFDDLAALSSLDWAAIRARDWRGKTHQKSAEFLVGDHFPWSSIGQIACYDNAAANRVRSALGAASTPLITVEPTWYY